MKTHEVVVWPAFLRDVSERTRVSRIDVGFEVGDHVLFRAWWRGEFTGSEERRRIVAIARPENLPDWVVMDLEESEVRR